MRIANTTRWITAGAALGLSAALSAGAALAATPGSSGHAGGSRSTAGASAHVLAAATTTTPAAATATTTTTTPSSDAPTPRGSSPMMSEMLASLSPQARSELQALYPQMLQFMDTSPMMGANGTAGSMVGQPVTGTGPTAGQAPAS